VFVTAALFQPNLTFADKLESSTHITEPQSTLVGSRLEVDESDKDTSLQQRGENSRSKKSCSGDPPVQVIGKILTC